MWIEKDLDLFLDLSTFCNAGCPICHRTKPGTTDKAEWLKEYSWSIEEVKKAYPKSFLKSYVQQVQICGTWGEPFMNKDIYDIIKYFLDGHVKKVMLNTNGSLRDEQFWWELGLLSYKTKRVVVCFDIDGIDQEMHSLYRQKTDLNKILNNMLAYKEGRGIAQSFTVVFKHNKPYLEQIEKLCKEHGSTYHINVESDRWYNPNNKPGVWEFIDSKGRDQVLEKII